MKAIKFDAGYRLLLSPYYVNDKRILSEFRKLPGVLSYDGEAWVIRYPLHDHNRTKLDGLIPKLERKIKRLVQADIQKSPQQIGEIEDLPELTVPIPVKRPLYPYQCYGLAYLLKHKRVIIGDQPGLGKTSQAAALMLAGRVIPEVTTLPALIVCPSTLKRKWQREIFTVTGLNAMILTDKYKNSWPYYLQIGMIDAVIVNFESLKKYFVKAVVTPPGGEFKLKDIVFNEAVKLFKYVIIDEVHKCKDGATQTAKYCMGITKGKEWIAALTGTPVVNKPYDLIAQLHVIDRLLDFGGYSYFKSRYCAGGKGSSNLEELNYRLSSICFYRREKKSVLPDLPDKTRQVVLCDIDNRAEYDHAEKNFVEYLQLFKGCSDKEIKKKLKAKFMVQLGILREISARGKIKAVQEWGDNLLESGEKIIIFCNLLDIIKRLKAIFPGSLEISGEIGTDIRDRYIELFQTSPKHRVIICNIKAGGVGIDLFASSNVGFIEFPWTYADCEQCEDRAHRDGQKSAVLASYFLGNDTVDQFVYEKIQEKKDIADTVTGAENQAEEIIDTLYNLITKRKIQKAELWR